MKKKENITISLPVPQPIKPPTITAPTTPEEVEKGDKKPAKAPILTQPKFNFELPSEIQIKEGELWKTIISATDPDGSPISYFYQCPYTCPEGISISDQGEVEWRPGFFQAGVYDIRFLASDIDGENGFSEYVRLTVENVNRSPIIEGTEVIPNKIISPDTLYCFVNKKDEDGDVMTTSRIWTVNGTDQPLFTGSILPINLFLANDKVQCRATVKDQNGAMTESLASEIYEVPNKSPKINSLTIINVSRPGEPLKVGDTIKCETNASDDDGHVVFKKESKIFSETGVDPLASITGTGELSYVIKKIDSHKNIFCSVKVSDSFSDVTGSSALQKIVNSAPIIKSVKLELIAPLLSLMTGSTVQCTTEYEDPDGDLMTSQMTFFNGAVSRGDGTKEFQNIQKSVNRYILRTREDVTNPLLSDVRGAQISCRAKVIDLDGNYDEKTSSSVSVVDRPPTLEISALGGQSLQRLYTNEKMQDVQLIGKDLDGDQVFFEKVSDTCTGENILFSVSSSGLLSAGVVPQAVYPHHARDCSVSYKARANNILTDSVSISLSIPNRAPTIVCSSTGLTTGGESPVTRYLKTSAENFQRKLISPLGQAIGEDVNGNPLDGSGVICVAKDPDGELAGSQIPSGGDFGDAFRFIFSDSLDATNCTLGSLDTGFYSESELRVAPRSSVSKRILASMGLDDCVKSIKVSDGDVLAGGFYSNEIRIELKPIISVKMSETTEFDNACNVSVSAASNYNNNYSYNLSNPSQASFDGGQVPGSSILIEEKKVTANISENVLESNNNAQDLLLKWTMKASGSDLSVTTREISRKWSVEKSINTDTLVYPWIPSSSLGKDSGEGRQVAPSSTCIKNSSCTGKRTSISAGNDHTCALQVSGLVSCWGSNEKKQLGYRDEGNSYSNQSSPQIVDGIDGTSASTRSVMLASGGQHTCALMEDGQVKCWGLNRYGQLGSSVVGSDGIGTAGFVKTPNGENLVSAVSIAAGNSHSCALIADGSIMCWGSNLSGQMGIKPTPWTLETCGLQPCYTGARVVPGIADAVGVYAGGDLSCAILKNGQGRCWGESTYGQLGTGTYPNIQQYENPYLVKSLENIVSFSIGAFNNCSVLKSGRSFCWGEGSYGQNGDGLLGNTTEAQTDKPVYQTGTAQISNGADFTCALTKDRKVECFGNNTISPGVLGQLGSSQADLSSTGKLKVKQVSTGAELTDVIALTSGLKHSCAVTLDRKVYCWGAGDKGQLGHGLFTPASNGAQAVTGGAFAASQTCTEIFSLLRQ